MYYNIPNLFKNIKIHDKDLINIKYDTNNKKSITNDSFSDNEIEYIMNTFICNESLNYVYIVCNNIALYNIIVNFSKNVHVSENINNINVKNDLIIINKYNTNIKNIITILESLIIQTIGSSFIFKTCELSDYIMYEILYLLSGLYEKIYIMSTKSKKVYNIICKKFYIENKDIIYKIYDTVKNINKNVQIIKIFKNDLPQIFVYKIDEYMRSFEKNYFDIQMKLITDINICKLVN